MKFKGIEPDQLQTFLMEQQSPVEEMHLFNTFYPHVPTDLSDFSFFEAHFYIHHGLYKLKKQLIHQGYLLSVLLSKVYILKIPGPGICSWFSESEISFCRDPAEGDFCAFHQKKNRERIGAGAMNSDPLQEYYLDLQNLEQLDEESFRQFTESGVYLAENIIKIQKALKLFSLASNASMTRITSRFRYMVKNSHPDAGLDPDYSFQEIKEAYDVLTAWKKQ